jgi:hypothetical protein
LTINLGVRSETHGGFSEKYNNAGGFDPTLTDPVASSGAYTVNPLGSIWFASAVGARTQSNATKTAVMPRFGFAWQPTYKWVVRGGVVQYASLWSNDDLGGAMGFGTGAAGSANVSSTATTPVVQLSQNGFGTLPIIQGANASTPLTYITPASTTGPKGSGGAIPYVPWDTPIQNGWQWMASAQYRLPGNMVVEAQYIGSHWTNMMFLADVNQLSAANLGFTDPGGIDAHGYNSKRPYPQFSGIGVGSNGARTGTYNGISNYQAASFTLHKPMSHGLAVEAFYTWSVLKDDMDDSGWGEQFGGAHYQDAYNPAANYALSNLNRTSVLKGTVLYKVPLGKGHQYLSSDIGDAVLGGWTASGDFIDESGAPITLLMNNPAQNGSLGSSDGNGESAWYPNKVGNPGSGGNINAWFNQLAYASPAVNTFGTNPRSSLNGPGLVWFDFSLAKSFSMPGWERGKLQIRMDANNVFNHPAFADPSSSLNPAALLSGTPDPSVGKITGTDGGGRVIELSARFSF